MDSDGRPVGLNLGLCHVDWTQDTEVFLDFHDAYLLAVGGSFTFNPKRVLMNCYSLYGAGRMSYNQVIEFAAWVDLTEVTIGDVELWM